MGDIRNDGNLGGVLEEARRKAELYMDLINLFTEMGVDPCARTSLILMDKRLDKEWIEHPLYSKARNLLDEVMILKGYKKREG